MKWNQLMFPLSVSRLCDIFNVSQLQKFAPNPFQHILPDTFDLVEDLAFQPQPSRIVDCAMKSLSNK